MLTENWLGHGKEMHSVLELFVVCLTFHFLRNKADWRFLVAFLVAFGFVFVLACAFLICFCVFCLVFLFLFSMLTFGLAVLPIPRL